MLIWIMYLCLKNRAISYICTVETQNREGYDC